MFDTHDSIAVRNAGDLITQELVAFNAALETALRQQKDKSNTPWYILLSKDSQFWEKEEIATCCQFILDTHWDVEEIKPPIILMEQYCHGPLPDEYDGENNLKDWCGADDRHMSFADAIIWSETEECSTAISTYLKEVTGLVPFDDDDPFNPFKDHSKEYTSNSMVDEGYSYFSAWYSIVEQINYVDSIAPGITTVAKIALLRIALISQPVSELSGSKKKYRALIKRELELTELLQNDKT